jgi:hypothetical protein
MTTITKKIVFGLLTGLLITACAEKKEKELKARDPDPERADVLYLTDVQHLVRVSLDLRGTRPSLGEIEAVQNAKDPQKKIREFAQEYMEDARFGERVKEIWNEGFLVRQDRPFFEGPPQLLGLLTEDDFARAATQEPLEIISHVVTHDRPFTEIITADYTMANEALAAYYDITRPTNEGRGWKESQYTDGRPNAGVLTSTSFYTRWTTTDSNQNRGRANAWTRAILCYDFFTRDIIVDTNLNLADPNVVNNAVRTNPSCVGCHVALDPLASHFFGYFIPEDMTDGERSYPIKTYSADLENRWMNGTGRGPGYFGFYEENPNLATLGEQIAADPGFSNCSVKRFTSVLTGVSMRQLEANNLDELDRLHDWFLETDYNAKKLIEEIVMSPFYRQAGPGAPMVAAYDELDELNPATKDANELHGLKLLSPEQLNRMLRDLTGNAKGNNPDGFGWKMEAPEGYDLFENDIFGFRMMAGGYDSMFVTAPAHTVNATHILTLRMASQDAANKLIDADFSQNASDRRLMTEVGANDTNENDIRNQLVVLNLLLYGEVVDVNHADVTSAWQLWSTVNARQDSTYAWKITLGAMLADVRVAFY